MALQRITIDGYGQVEINNCAFRRDGRIAAQCKPNTTDFASIPVENGMLLAVDEVNRQVKLPAANDGLPYALVYSAEHIYDERTPGLKSFKLNGSDDYFPRLGYLAIGDKWTENALCFDDTEYAATSEKTAEQVCLEAVAAYKTTAIWGGISTTGMIKISNTKPTVGPALRVIDKTTMPDGTLGVKFQVFTA